MYPVRTFIRHKLIHLTVLLSKAVYALSGGKRPKFLFSSAVKTRDIQTGVRVLERTSDSVTVAKFNSEGKIDNGNFKIITATDLHLESGSPEKNNRSLQEMINRIQEEKPDLVIITGDAVLSDCQQIDAVQLSMLMEKTGVYWAYAFGNHEAREEKEYFKYLLYKGLMYCKHSLCTFGKPELFGYGNFAIHIKNQDGSIYKSLYLFDSGRDITQKHRESHGLSDELEGYDFLKNGQIEWYLNSVREAQKLYGATKTLCYMHIPLPEYKNVFNGSEKEGFTLSDKCEFLYGTQFESVGCSSYNSGFFEKALAEGSLQGIFAGHDHINDFCAKYKGVYLVYSQCTGYNTYSMADKFGRKEEDCHFGVTLTTLLPDGNISVEQRKNSASGKEAGR